MLWKRSRDSWTFDFLQIQMARNRWSLCTNKARMPGNYDQFRKFEVDPWINLRDESNILNLDNFACQYTFFVMAVGSLFYTNDGTRTDRGWRYGGVGVLEIEILLEVTIRRIAVVLGELVAVGLRKVPDLCLGKCSR